MAVVFKKIPLFRRGPAPPPGGLRAGRGESRRPRPKVPCTPSGSAGKSCTGLCISAENFFRRSSRRRVPKKFCGLLPGGVQLLPYTPQECRATRRNAAKRRRRRMKALSRKGPANRNGPPAAILFPRPCPTARPPCAPGRRPGPPPKASGRKGGREPARAAKFKNRGNLCIQRTTISSASGRALTGS